MRIEIPKFETKSELYGWLKTNKANLIAEKKSMPITAEAVSFGVSKVHSKTFATKANAPVHEDIETLRVKVVANTANWIDSSKHSLAFLKSPNCRYESPKFS